MKTLVCEHKGHRIWWDEERKIVRAVGGGTVDEETAYGMLAEAERLAAKHGNGLDWLLDLSGITAITSRNRKILASASVHPSICKQALVGATAFMRMVTNIILAPAQQVNARHFAIVEEALLWIAEEKT